jgi:hypothetical protein
VDLRELIQQRGAGLMRRLEEIEHLRTISETSSAPVEIALLEDEMAFLVGLMGVFVDDYEAQARERTLRAA